MAKQTDLVCENCGSSEIETVAWVDANTNKYVTEWEDAKDDHHWCRNCEQHTGFEMKKQFMAKWLEPDLQNDPPERSCESCGSEKIHWERWDKGEEIHYMKCDSCGHEFDASLA